MGFENCLLVHASVIKIRQNTSAKLAALLTDMGVRLKLARFPDSAINHCLESLQECSSYMHAVHTSAVAQTDHGDTTLAKCNENCLKLNQPYVEA